LAESGILNGKRATTHWSAASRLQARYPAITVDAESIFLREGNTWTSAGVTAGIDLALAMVEDDFGLEVALEVARDLLVYLKRPGGQSQVSHHLESQMTHHPKIRELQSWILSHVAENLSVPMLAAKVAMSDRNFARVFQRETSASPADFIEMARFELARQLIVGNCSSLKLIACKAGFGSEEKMRRVFRKRLGVTPRAYIESVSTNGMKAIGEKIPAQSHYKLREVHIPHPSAGLACVD
jgi:transcriptional regulator GlxA family with amidase domain